MIRLLYKKQWNFLTLLHNDNDEIRTVRPMHKCKTKKTITHTGSNFNPTFFLLKNYKKPKNEIDYNKRIRLYILENGNYSKSSNQKSWNEIIVCVNVNPICKIQLRQRTTIRCIT